MPAAQKNTIRYASRAAVLVVLAAFSLTGCAPEPEPEPVVLTVSEAGSAYLGAVCPVNDAWDELDLAVDQLRLSLDAGGSQEVAMERLDVALDRVGKQSLAAAKSLDDPERVWPTGAAKRVREVADTLTADHAVTVKVTKLTPEQAAAFEWPGAAESAETAAAAREALGLPADTELACAERPTGGPGLAGEGDDEGGDGALPASPAPSTPTPSTPTPSTTAPPKPAQSTPAQSKPTEGTKP